MFLLRHANIGARFFVPFENLTRNFQNHTQNMSCMIFLLCLSPQYDLFHQKKLVQVTSLCSMMCLRKNHNRFRAKKNMGLIFFAMFFYHVFQMFSFLPKTKFEFVHLRKYNLLLFLDAFIFYHFQLDVQRISCKLPKIHCGNLEKMKKK